MGQILGTLKTKHLGLEMDDEPSFPPAAGFKYSRQKRVMKVSSEALSSAKIPIKYRDFCADILLEYQVCRYKHMPLVYRCHHEKHAYLNCEHQDYILRMKEFERERRLRERELRVTGSSATTKQPQSPTPPPTTSPPTEQPPPPPKPTPPPPPSSPPPPPSSPPPPPSSPTPPVKRKVPEREQILHIF